MLYYFIGAYLRIHVIYASGYVSRVPHVFHGGVVNYERSGYP